MLFEPRSIQEDIALPLVLGLGCLLLFALGLFRVIAAQKKTTRVVADWLKDATAVDTGVAAPTFRAGVVTPPLTLVGVCSPRVVVSRATVVLLSADELRVAVRHEVAHIRSQDNLKKLCFHCSPFPCMSGLENAWHEAAELAADDGAVATLSDALDLAAALIKLSRLIPASSGLEWPGVSHPQTRWHYAIPATLAALLCAAILYSPVLARTHTITEWLVR